MEMLSYEEQEALREMRRNEPGALSPCPFCQTPRVQRSDYVRCNLCGINWLDEEMHLPNYLNLHPKVARGLQRQSVSTATKTALSVEDITAAAEYNRP